MILASDNASGVAPEILAALERANAGTAMPYGADETTARLRARLAEVFETEVEVFPVVSGTAANVLTLAPMTPPYGAIYCHAEAHINTDECGAPELYTGGAKLMGLPGAHGKLAPEDLAAALERAGIGDVHHAQPAALSLTQASEAGTVYAPEEVAALAEVAHGRGLKVQMDGARLANALARLGCTPAEATWKAGVDALAFGATKNGAMAAEAAVFFDRALAASVGYRRKRGGHLLSKMRFVSAQLEAYLAGGLWLRLAAHANARAARLAEGLAALPGCELLHPVEANEVFARLPEAALAGLEAAGFVFYRWAEEGPGAVRLVASFSTREADVEALLAEAARHCG